MIESRKSITVLVQLHGLLRDYHPNADGPTHHPVSVTLTAAKTVKALLPLFNIPEGLVAGVAVNGNTAELSDTLNENDTILLFPPLAGG